MKRMPLIVCLENGKAALAVTSNTDSGRRERLGEN